MEAQAVDLKQNPAEIHWSSQTYAETVFEGGISFTAAPQGASCAALTYLKGTLLNFMTTLSATE